MSLLIYTADCSISFDDLHVLHPEFFRRASLDNSTYSIKNVLPVLVEGQDYKNLDGVASGLDASLDYVRLINGIYDLQEEQRLRSDLLAYCKLDTQALTEIQLTLLSMAK
jgi:hypothetical protein